MYDDAEAKAEKKRQEQMKRVLKRNKTIQEKNHYFSDEVEGLAFRDPPVPLCTLRHDFRREFSILKKQQDLDEIKGLVDCGLTEVLGEQDAGHDVVVFLTRKRSLQ